MKILLVHLGGSADDELAAALREYGHDVRVASNADDGDAPWEDYRPGALVARLEADTAQCLDLVAAIAARPGLGSVPILVTGGNELAVTAARRRFPDASFARLDTVQTALASLEAGE